MTLFKDFKSKSPIIYKYYDDYSEFLRINFPDVYSWGQRPITVDCLFCETSIYEEGCRNCWVLECKWDIILSVYEIFYPIPK